MRVGDPLDPVQKIVDVRVNSKLVTGDLISIPSLITK